jgi:hypothetical protein
VTLSRDNFNQDLVLIMKPGTFPTGWPAGR